MSHRQSGAAHVPIFLFLILLVMFLGALGFAYVQTDANTALRDRIKEMESSTSEAAGKVILRDHYAEDIGAVLGMPGSYSGRERFMEEYKGTTLAEQKGIVSPSELKAKINDFAKSIQLIGNESVPTLADLFTAAGAKFEAQSQRIKDLEAQLARALADKQAVDASYAKATTEHSNAARQWGQTLDQVRTDYNSTVAGKDSQINSLAENLRQEKERAQTAQESFAAEKKSLQNDIGRLQGHTTALVARETLRQPANTPDGKVISARSGLDSAYINLGRKDMLKADTIFRVRAPNSDEVKGYAVVTRVEQDKAEVRLTNVVDRVGNPIAEGDLLYNDLYSPNMRRVIYLMGEFRYPYNKPQLKTLLENLGNTVVTKMAPGVDTVVLGDNVINEEGSDFADIKETQEYKEAVFLGVEFAPLRKIRDLIKQ